MADDHLNWRDYFTFDFSSVAGQDVVYAARTTAAMEQIFNSELGQKALQSIAAQVKASGEKIVFTNRRDRGCVVRMDARAQHFASVNLNFEYLAKRDYLGEDGNYYPFSITHMLIHELVGHIAHKEHDEDKTIAITNEFMAALKMPDMPRIGHDSYDRKREIDTKALPSLASLLDFDQQQELRELLERAPRFHALSEDGTRTIEFINGNYTLPAKDRVALQELGKQLLDFAHTHKLDLFKTSFAYFDVDQKLGLSPEEAGAALVALQMTTVENGKGPTETVILSFSDSLGKDITRKQGSLARLNDLNFREQALAVTRELLGDNFDGFTSLETNTPEGNTRFNAKMRQVDTPYVP